MERSYAHSVRVASCRGGQCYLAAVTDAAHGQLPPELVVADLRIILVQLIELANLKEQHYVPVFFLDVPVLLLGVRKLCL